MVAFDGCPAVSFHFAPAARASTRFLRGVKVGRDDADEIAVANDLDAGHRGGLARVERGERRFEGRGAEDLAMEESGALDVGRVIVRARDELAAIHLGRRRAGDRPLRRRSDERRRRLGGKCLDELLPARQIAVREKPIRARIDDAAVGRREIAAPDPPARGREIHERLARGGGDRAKLRPHRRRRAAAEGPGVPGNEVGVAHDEVDRVHADAQLLGDLLGERRADVLAHLDFSREDRHAALGVDREPGGELPRKLVRFASAAARLLRERHGFGSGRGDEQPAAEETQKPAAVEIEPVEDRDRVLGELGGGWHPLLTPAGRSLRETRPSAAAGPLRSEGRPLALPRSPRSPRWEDRVIRERCSVPLPAHFGATFCAADWTAARMRG